ncbi:hypothetical protein V9K67_12780 [Paraflavisolibacter sp. H34]|uniref:hypothetical protein n=1 Tax=Huijunlia imazamoxiresistens TaxID=3127457 RepID=UPI00301A3744
MAGSTHHNAQTISPRYVVPDTRDCYTCSFTEFYPFCSKLYYFSSYKEFNGLSRA